MSWEAIDGVSRYSVWVGESYHLTLTNSIDLNDPTKRTHIATHTKIKVIADDLSNEIYVTYADNIFTISTQAVPKLDQPSNFRTIYENGRTYLQFDLSPNSPNKKSIYYLYYADGDKHYAVSVSEADTKGSFSLSSIESWLKDDTIIKVLVKGHSGFASSDAVSLTIRRLPDNTFIIVNP